MDKNIWIRIASALPICGHALALWLEHIQLQPLRGAIVGLVIAVTLLGLSEGVVATFEIIRFKLEVCCLSRIKQRIGAEESRKAADELNRPYYEREKQKKLSEASPVTIANSTNCPEGGPIKPCFWSAAMGRYGKLHYILGVHDAVSGNHDLHDQLFRKEWTYGEHIERLDKYYAGGDHADIPVIDAMREVRGR